jgi:hypothetical protein
MALRIIFICVWTVFFLFGGTILFGFAFGLHLPFTMRSWSGQQPSQQMVSWFEMSLPFVPWVLGSVALLFGILGWLPGTRRTNS